MTRISCSSSEATQTAQTEAESNAPPDAPTATDLRIVKVVVASASDVGAERQVLAEVVNEVNAAITSSLRIWLDLYLREDFPFSENSLESSVDRTEIAEIYVGIISRRMGTVTGSGTEEELRRALDRFRQTGRPLIRLYFDDSRSRVSSGEDVSQFERVVRFRREIEKDVSVATYDSTDAFRDQVRVT
jgi:hypothetical protein